VALEVLATREGFVATGVGAGELSPSAAVAARGGGGCGGHTAQAQLFLSLLYSFFAYCNVAISYQKKKDEILINNKGLLRIELADF
jgi:hypothetical protein